MYWSQFWKILVIHPKLKENPIYEKLKNIVKKAEKNVRFLEETRVFQRKISILCEIEQNAS